MKFLVIKKMNGEGCDYTIGCGMTYDWIEADNTEHAEELVVYPDGRDEWSSVDPDKDMCLTEILIVPASDVHKVNVAEWSAKVKQANDKEASNRLDEKERAEYERLSKKFGKTVDEKRHEFEELISDAPDGIDLLRFTCINCNNGCLVSHIPTTCHPGCDAPNWKLNKWQDGYIVGRAGYKHPKGEY